MLDIQQSDSYSKLMYKSARYPQQQKGKNSSWRGRQCKGITRIFYLLRPFTRSFNTHIHTQPLLQKSVVLNGTNFEEPVLATLQILCIVGHLSVSGKGGVGVPYRYPMRQ